jgi:hypothetical protein
MSKPRRELVGAERAAKAMPPLLPGDVYLLQDFTATGRMRHGDMGTIPLTWQDIAAWESVSGADITGDEAALLHTLSVAYVGAYRSASGKNPQPPFVGPGVACPPEEGPGDE